MYTSLKLKLVGLPFVVVVAVFPFAMASADEVRLSLDNAEALALHDDPAIRMAEARTAALDEQAIAAGQLPDPMFRVGAVSLPTDTFNLGQEPMTQVQVGVVQKFPRGQSLSLQQDQYHQYSDSMQAMTQDQRMATLRSVREAYIEVLLQVRMGEINANAISAFADLEDITQDYYATGKAPQQDVLRASVELAKVRDRATRIAQDQDVARAQLALWIGDAAYRPLRADWPDLASVPAAAFLLDGLAQHPRIRAAQQQVLAAQTGIELARQRYKPELSLDLSYGARGGVNADGRSRPDLFSAMLVMDVPLFTAQRQDRIVAARASESSAATFSRDDTWRQMKSQVQQNAAKLVRQRERQALFREILLPDASFNAISALEAYQAAVADLTTLMRARIIEFELQLEFAQLQADLLKTQARLLYLGGTS